MYVFLIILHLLICLGLVCVVLIQSGKGGGLAGGAFGGSAQTVLGGRGATDFITRATMVLGAAFFVMSLTLAIMSAGRGRAPASVLQREARRQPQPGAAPGQQRAPAQAPAPGQQRAPAEAPAPTPGGGTPRTGGGGH